MATMSESIGFIGLGIMGKPMAHNLLKAGFPLVVQNLYWLLGISVRKNQEGNNHTRTISSPVW